MTMTFRSPAEVAAAAALDAAQRTAVSPSPRIYPNRAAFLAASTPEGVTRAGFIQGGRTYSVIRDASGPIAQANSQTWAPDGDIWVEHFGAVADGATDAQPAIQAAVDWLIARDTPWTLRFAIGDYRLGDQIDLTAATQPYALIGFFQQTQIWPDPFGPTKACFKHASIRFRQWGFTLGNGTAHKNHPIGIEARLSGRANIGGIIGSGLGNTVLFTTRPFNADWEGPFDLFFCGWQPLHKDVDVGAVTLSITASSATVTASADVFDAGDEGKDIQIYHDSAANEAITATIVTVNSATEVVLSSSMLVTATGRRFSFGPITAVATGTGLVFAKDVGLEAADVGRMIYIDKAGTHGKTHETTIASVTNGGECVLTNAVAANGTWRVFFTPTVYIGNHDNEGNTGPNDIYIDKMLVEGFSGPGILVSSGLHVKFGELKTHGRAWGDFSNFGRSAEPLLWGGNHKSFIRDWELEFCGMPTGRGLIRVAGTAPGLSLRYLSHNAPLVGGYLFDVDFDDTVKSSLVLPEINGRSNLSRFLGLVLAPSDAVRRRITASGRIGGASAANEASFQYPQIVGSARAFDPVFINDGASFVLAPASPAGVVSVFADDASGFWGLFKFNSVGTVLVVGAPSASTTLETITSLNVNFSGGLLTIQNNSGASRRYHVAMQG